MPSKKESYIGITQAEQLTYAQMKAMSEKELKAVARTYRKVLDQRNKAKEKAGIEVRQAEKSIAASKNDSKTDLLRKISAMRSASHKETSTVTSWKKKTEQSFSEAFKGAQVKWKQGQLQIIIKSGKGKNATKNVTVLSSSDVSKFWSKFHQLRDEAGANAGSLASGEILKVISNEYTVNGEPTQKRMEQLHKWVNENIQNTDLTDDMPWPEN